MERLVNLFKNEIGYLEKATNDDLQDKKSNAGRGNYTKYANYLDSIKYFNTRKNGYNWCAVFIHYIFIKFFGVEKAKKLLHIPERNDLNYGASCTWLGSQFKANNAFTKSAEKGSLVFFFDGSREFGHVGFVFKVDSKYIYTIEGNTSDSAEVIPNGGSVSSKKYLKSNSKIAGYAHINYDFSSEVKITDDVISNIISGKMGNGYERKEELKKLGYTFKQIEEIQRLVNERIATDSKEVVITEKIITNVIRGVYGNGNLRKKKLSELGFSEEQISEIQKRVNSKLK